MTAEREAFMDKVRAALSTPTTHGRGEMAYADLAAKPAGDPATDVLALLAENAAALNLDLHIAPNPAAAAAALGDIVASTEPEWDHQKAVVAWDDALLNQMALETALVDSGLILYRAPGAEAPMDADRRAAFRRQLGEALIGITTADFCVADTATLVLRNRPGQPGAVGLVPSVHVAVIREAQLLPDINALYERLAAERRTDPEALTGRMTFISGPSKTGDIELVIVHGAHGPRALHLIVIGED
ncbi:MAG: LUD domain-containing protein [Desulfosarcinaceae bacterium]|jgi:L-lactate dehydrogenase complex protein LldG